MDNIYKFYFFLPQSVHVIDKIFILLGIALIILYFDDNTMLSRIKRNLVHRVINECSSEAPEI